MPSDCTELFFKCWRNIYINKIINQFVRAFQNIYNYTKIIKITKKIIYENIQHKNYIQYLDFSKTTDDISLELSKLPFYLRELILPDNFTSELKPDELNGLLNLKTLKFGRLFNNVSINQENVLPKGLETISLGENLTKPLILGGLINLKVVVLPERWNLALNHENLQLPDSIEHLEFGVDFNQKISKTFQLPKNLKTLVFKKLFNSEIEVLPVGLKSLKLNDHFNREIKIGVLPNTLEQLEFGQKFSKPLQPGIINKGLKRLILGQCFNEPLVVGSLPDSLEYCHFSKNYGQKLLKGVLPDSLKSIGFNFDYSIDNIFDNDSLPKNLNQISFGGEFNIEFTSLEFFPPNIKSIHIFSDKYRKKFTVNSFPPTIESLYLYTLKYCSPNDLIGIFKKGLKKLTISSFKKNETPYIKGIFPQGLEFLKISSPICKDLLPNSLKELILDGDEKMNFSVGYLPQSLKKLTIITYFEPLVIGSLPDSIEELVFGLFPFNQPISKELLPKSLKKLTFCNNFPFDFLNEELLPEGLESLTIRNLNDLKNLDLTKMKSLFQLKVLNESNYRFGPLPIIKLPTSLQSFKFSSMFKNDALLNSQWQTPENDENRYLSMSSMLSFSEQNQNENCSSRISLKKLIWNSNLLIRKGEIPTTVEYLEFGKNYEGCRFFPEGLIPFSVKTLVFKGFSPSSLKTPSSVVNLSLLSSSLFTIDSKNSIETLNLSYTTYLNPQIPINLDISKVHLNFTFYRDPMDEYWS